MTFKFLAVALGGVTNATHKQVARAKKRSFDDNIMSVSLRKYTNLLSAGANTPLQVNLKWVRAMGSEREL